MNGVDTKPASQSGESRGWSIKGASRALLVFVGAIFSLVLCTYFFQATKLQYVREAQLLVAKANGEISTTEYTQLAADNSLINVMLEPDAVWGTD